MAYPCRPGFASISPRQSANPDIAVDRSDLALPTRASSRDHNAHAAMKERSLPFFRGAKVPDYPCARVMLDAPRAQERREFSELAVELGD